MCILVRFLAEILTQIRRIYRYSIFKVKIICNKVGTELQTLESPRNQETGSWEMMRILRTRILVPNTEQNRQTNFKPVPFRKHVADSDRNPKVDLNLS